MHVPGHIEIWWEPLPRIVDWLTVHLLVRFPRFLSVPAPNTADGLAEGLITELYCRSIPCHKMYLCFCLSQYLIILIAHPYIMFLPGCFSSASQSVVVLNLPVYIHVLPHWPLCRLRFRVWKSIDWLHVAKTGQWQPCLVDIPSCCQELNCLYNSIWIHILHPHT